jgi:uncharacterized membrane protein
MQTVRPKVLGAAGGLLLGWLIVQYGLFAAAFVVLLGVIGWLAGRVIEGELDLSAYMRRPADRELE